MWTSASSEGTLSPSATPPGCGVCLVLCQSLSTVLNFRMNERLLWRAGGRAGESHPQTQPYLTSPFKTPLAFPRPAEAFRFFFPCECVVLCTYRAKGYYYVRLPLNILRTQVVHTIVSFWWNVLLPYSFCHRFSRKILVENVVHYVISLLVRPSHVIAYGQACCIPPHPRPTVTSPPGSWAAARCC